MVLDVPPPPALGPEEGDLLLRIALQAIQGQWRVTSEAIVPPKGSALRAPAGVFVSLYKGENLRGCLGVVSPSEPLDQTVREIALASATRDPRFDPVLEGEFRDLSIEISVLGPLTPVPTSDPQGTVSSIVVGEHGLLIRFRERSGLLLPQVPLKYGWNAVRFLEETCFKAGLYRDAWRQSEAELLAFRCSIFKGKAGEGR